MAEPIRLFIVCGEHSGDRIGADLLKRMRIERPVEPSGVGGPELEGEGLRSLFPMSDLSVMGLNDVLKRLPLLIWRMRQTADAILAQNPDIVVLIDSQVFMQTVAQRVRKAGYRGKILLYVAPAVWAWKPERAPLLKPLYDEILAVLPFEPAVMKRLGGPLTSYVGHPALEHTSLRKAQPERGPMLLLPGSRRGELKRHLPLMEVVAKAFRRHPRVSGFVLPTPRSEHNRVVSAITGWETPVFVTSSAEDKRKAFNDAVAAAACSGTVTLELALTGTPMVVTYVGERAQARHFKRYTGRFISLPNILYGDALVPELIDLKPRPEDLIQWLDRLLGEPGAIERQRDGFARIRSGMETGTPEAPRSDPAERVLSHLSGR